MWSHSNRMWSHSIKDIPIPLVHFPVEHLSISRSHPTSIADRHPILRKHCWWSFACHQHNTNNFMWRFKKSICRMHTYDCERICDMYILQPTSIGRNGGKVLCSWKWVYLFKRAFPNQIQWRPRTLMQMSVFSNYARLSDSTHTRRRGKMVRNPTSSGWRGVNWYFKKYPTWPRMYLVKERPKCVASQSDYCTPVAGTRTPSPLAN